MELGAAQEKIKQFFSKYKYAALVLMIGILLMCLPTKKVNSTEGEPVITQNEVSVNEELANILSQIEGAGDVQVFLTVASGEETVFQMDQSLAHSDTGSTTKSDTVTVTDADRNQRGLVKQRNPPVYRGAIIVCEGAARPSVQLAIVTAVSRVTGLTSDKISVLKMK